MKIDLKYDETKTVWVIGTKSINGKHKIRKGLLWYIKTRLSDHSTEYGIRLEDTNIDNEYYETEIFDTAKEAQAECNVRNSIEEHENNKLKEYDDVWYVRNKTAHRGIITCFQYGKRLTYIIADKQGGDYRVDGCNLFKTRREAREFIKLQKGN